MQTFDNLPDKLLNSTVLWGNQLLGREIQKNMSICQNTLSKSTSIWLICEKFFDKPFAFIHLIQ